MSVLQFININYSRDNKKILNNISISIDPGDFISITGPSGSGKSTILKLCCNLISADSGSILYNDTNILEYEPSALRQRICYCFQMPRLFGSVVEDNLIFPYAIRNMKMDIIRVETLLKNFNLKADILKEEIKNLSGGEKQRIALIRTLLFKPDIILLDEVTSALDVENTSIVEDSINKLNKEGVTVLWVTHNPEQSRKYANKLLRLENGIIEKLEVLR